MRCDQCGSYDDVQKYCFECGTKLCARCRREGDNIGEPHCGGSDERQEDWGLPDWGDQ